MAFNISVQAQYASIHLTASLKRHQWIIGRFQLQNISPSHPFTTLSFPLCIPVSRHLQDDDSLLAIKMSFFDIESSFFLDATASSCQPSVQILPLNDAEAFDYLDAHPDALFRYLKGRVGLVESFSKTLTQGKNVLGKAASGKEVTPATVEQMTAEEFYANFDDAFLSPATDAEQALIEWGFGEEVEDDERLVSDGVPPQAGPEECPSRISGASISPVLLFSPSSPPTPPPSSLSPSPPPPPPSPSLPPASPPPKSEEDESSSSDGTDPFRPYPAPARLVEKSKRKPPGKAWRLFEQEACIRHMLDIRDEGVLTGEARFQEAHRRMELYDGIRRGGCSVVKNFWNRFGRARSGFDERKNKHAPLATSQQGNRAKSLIPKPTQRKQTSSSIKTKTKSEPSSDSSDSESDYTIHSDEPEPVKHQPRKRGRDDSEDEWAPDSATINAVAKGLRTPKKARLAH